MAETLSALPTPPPAPVERRHVPAVVVGWVQAGPLDETQNAALMRARAMVREALRAALPGFKWSFPLVRRTDLYAGGQEVEPVDLLDAGATERRVAGWDFALVATGADLRARFRPFTLATPSQALDVAALSLARLDPGARHPDLSDAERTERFAHRLAALALHAFGHLNGLDHETHEDAVMYPPRSPADLDRSSLSFTEPNRTEIEAEVADVADLRMEEETVFDQLGDAAFALKALVLNWNDVADTVLQIRPWRFPFQLSKLTTAAISTLIVLVMTAEAWDLGARQPLWHVAWLAVVAVAGTSAYLVRKQGLLARRHGQTRTEQQVVQSASILLALGLGMSTTWALLFGATLVLRLLFFDGAILDGWAASLGRSVGPDEVLAFAGFVSSLGIGVGALGASFEDQTYFRHVAYVDEET
ncbi:DUF2391 domain-containing protein [Rubrivirga sp.]|uniref:DUF2391 domain-containing protein n=1 Tax=Rubrivirga sp. TaxID=1885344 RepID=UPI003B52EAF9